MDVRRDASTGRDPGPEQIIDFSFRSWPHARPPSPLPRLAPRAPPLPHFSRLFLADSPPPNRVTSTPLNRVGPSLSSSPRAAKPSPWRRRPIPPPLPRPRQRPRPRPRLPSRGSRRGTTWTPSGTRASTSPSAASPTPPSPTPSPASSSSIRSCRSVGLGFPTADARCGREDADARCGLLGLVALLPRPRAQRR